MLRKLTDKINYTAIELNAMNRLTPFEKGQWTATTQPVKSDVKIIKERVKFELNRFQRHCVYCGALLWDSSNPEIEHIAPKYKYPEFMYHEYNLVFACHLCNGFFRKGKKDTIEDYDTQYDKCTFKIVHPYFDDFNVHFSYTHTTIHKLVIVPLTMKAINSVEMFDLNDLPRVEARGKRLIAESITLTPDQERMLREIVEYKYS